MRSSRIGTTGFLLLILLGFGLGMTTGCGSPCGNLWKKLERCAKTNADRRIYKSKDQQRAFLSRCKKADKSRIKSCIKLQDCDKLRRCAIRIRNKYK